MPIDYVIVFLIALSFLFGMFAGNAICEWRASLKASSRAFLTMMVYEKVSSKALTAEDGADILLKMR